MITHAYGVLSVYVPRVYIVNVAVVYLTPGKYDSGDELRSMDLRRTFQNSFLKIRGVRNRSDRKKIRNFIKVQNEPFDGSKWICSGLPMSVARQTAAAASNSICRREYMCVTTTVNDSGGGWAEQTDSRWTRAGRVRGGRSAAAERRLARRMLDEMNNRCVPRRRPPPIRLICAFCSRSDALCFCNDFSWQPAAFRKRGKKILLSGETPNSETRVGHGTIIRLPATTTARGGPSNNTQRVFIFFWKSKSFSNHVRWLKIPAAESRSYGLNGPFRVVTVLSGGILRKSRTATKRN